MKKKTKIIILSLTMILAIAMSIIPSFAADGQTYYFYVRDSHVLATLIDPIEINIIDDRTYFITEYDTTTYKLYFYQSNDSSLSHSATNTTPIYQMQLNQYSYVVVTYNRGNSEINYTVGYSAENKYTIVTTGETSTEYTYIEVAIYNNQYTIGYTDGENNVIDNPTDYNLYTQTQYTNYGNAQYVNGRNVVLNNPHNYNLYSQAEYIAYGTQEYNRGYAAGLPTAGNTYQDGYNAGLQQGNKDSKTITNLANVGLTGIYYTFTTFMNNAGIFGTTLAAVTTTAIIILVIYVIYKAVRS